MSEFKRRKFLKTTAGMAATSVVAGGMVFVPKYAEAYTQFKPEKGARLRVLRWSRFVQGDIDQYMKNVAAFSAKTGGSTSSIFAIRAGEGELAGLTNGGIQVEEVGALETKDARRWRCKWYVSLALFSSLAIARLDGISAGDVVA